MTENGSKPAPDVALLTPNDWRRLRVALAGRNPQELLDGEMEDIYQLLILAYRLRDDPGFTWEQAGDISPPSMFDFTQAGQSPPDLPAPPSSGNGSSPVSTAAATSKTRRTGSGRGRSSASTTA
jgi:hypothetical protein